MTSMGKEIPRDLENLVVIIFAVCYKKNPVNCGSFMGHKLFPYSQPSCKFNGDMQLDDGMWMN